MHAWDIFLCFGDTSHLIHVLVTVQVAVKLNPQISVV